MDQAQALFETVKAVFGDLIVGLKDFQWDQVPDAVKQYLVDNPGTSALQLACLLVTVVPGLIATSALLAMGFSATGPTAGWLAATFQSMYGVNVVFSTLQSAAMGEYGVAIVNGVIQASSAVTGALWQGWRWASGNGTA